MGRRISLLFVLLFYIGLTVARERTQVGLQFGAYLANEMFSKWVRPNISLMKAELENDEVESVDEKPLEFLEESESVQQRGPKHIGLRFGAYLADNMFSSWVRPSVPIMKAEMKESSSADDEPLELLQEREELGSNAKAKEKQLHEVQNLLGFVHAAHRRGATQEFLKKHGLIEASPNSSSSMMFLEVGGPTGMEDFSNEEKETFRSSATGGGAGQAVVHDKTLKFEDIIPKESKGVFVKDHKVKSHIYETVAQLKDINLSQQLHLWLDAVVKRQEFEYVIHDLITPVRSFDVSDLSTVRKQVKEEKSFYESLFPDADEIEPSVGEEEEEQKQVRIIANISFRGLDFDEFILENETNGFAEKNGAFEAFTKWIVEQVSNVTDLSKHQMRACNPQRGELKFDTPTGATTVKLVLSLVPNSNLKELKNELMFALGEKAGWTTRKDKRVPLFKGSDITMKEVNAKDPESECKNLEPWDGGKIASRKKDISDKRMVEKDCGHYRCAHPRAAPGVEAIAKAKAEAEKKAIATARKIAKRSAKFAAKTLAKEVVKERIAAPAAEAAKNSLASDNVVTEEKLTALEKTTKSAGKRWLDEKLNHTKGKEKEEHPSVDKMFIGAESAAKDACRRSIKPTLLKVATTQAEHAGAIAAVEGMQVALEEEGQKKAEEAARQGENAARVSAEKFIVTTLANELLADLVPEISVLPSEFSSKEEEDFDEEHPRTMPHREIISKEENKMHERSTSSTLDEDKEEARVCDFDAENGREGNVNELFSDTTEENRSHCGEIILRAAAISLADKCNCYDLIPDEIIKNNLNCRRYDKVEQTIKEERNTLCSHYKELMKMHKGVTELATETAENISKELGKNAAVATRKSIISSILTYMKRIGDQEAEKASHDVADKEAENEVGPAAAKLCSTIAKRATEEIIETWKREDGITDSPPIVHDTSTKVDESSNSSKGDVKIAAAKTKLLKQVVGKTEEAVSKMIEAVAENAITTAVEKNLSNQKDSLDIIDQNLNNEIRILSKHAAVKATEDESTLINSVSYLSKDDKEEVEKDADALASKSAEKSALKILNVEKDKILKVAEKEANQAARDSLGKEVVARKKLVSAKLRDEVTEDAKNKVEKMFGSLKGKTDTDLPSAKQTMNIEAIATANVMEDNQSKIDDAVEEVSATASKTVSSVRQSVEEKIIENEKAKMIHMSEVVAEDKAAEAAEAIVTAKKEKLQEEEGDLNPKDMEELPKAKVAKVDLNFTGNPPAEGSEEAAELTEWVLTTIPGAERPLTIKSGSGSGNNSRFQSISTTKKVTTKDGNPHFDVGFSVLVDDDNEDATDLSGSVANALAQADPPDGFEAPVVNVLKIEEENPVDRLNKMKIGLKESLHDLKDAEENLKNARDEKEKALKRDAKARAQVAVHLAESEIKGLELEINATIAQTHADKSTKNSEEAEALAAEASFTLNETEKLRRLLQHMLDVKENGKKHGTYAGMAAQMYDDYVATRDRKKLYKKKSEEGAELALRRARLKLKSAVEGTQLSLDLTVDETLDNFFDSEPIIEIATTGPSSPDNVTGATGNNGVIDVLNAATGPMMETMTVGTGPTGIEIDVLEVHEAPTFATGVAKPEPESKPEPEIELFETGPTGSMFETGATGGPDNNLLDTIAIDVDNLNQSERSEFFVSIRIDRNNLKLGAPFFESIRWSLGKTVQLMLRALDISSPLVFVESVRPDEECLKNIIAKQEENDVMNDGRVLENFTYGVSLETDSDRAKKRILSTDFSSTCATIAQLRVNVKASQAKETKDIFFKQPPLSKQYSNLSHYYVQKWLIEQYGLVPHAFKDVKVTFGRGTGVIVKDPMIEMEKQQGHGCSVGEFSASVTVSECKFPCDSGYAKHVASLFVSGIENEAVPLSKIMDVKCVNNPEDSSTTIHYRVAYVDIFEMLLIEKHMEESASHGKHTLPHNDIFHVGEAQIKFDETCKFEASKPEKRGCRKFPAPNRMKDATFHASEAANISLHQLSNISVAVDATKQELAKRKKNDPVDVDEILKLKQQLKDLNTKFEEAFHVHEANKRRQEWLTNVAIQSESREYFKSYKDSQGSNTVKLRIKALTKLLLRGRCTADLTWLKGYSSNSCSETALDFPLDQQKEKLLKCKENFPRQLPQCKADGSYRFMQCTGHKVNAATKDCRCVHPQFGTELFMGGITNPIISEQRCEELFNEKAVGKKEPYNSMIIKPLDANVLHFVVEKWDRDGDALLSLDEFHHMGCIERTDRTCDGNLPTGSTTSEESAKLRVFQKACNLVASCRESAPGEIPGLPLMEFYLRFVMNPLALTGSPNACPAASMFLSCIKREVRGEREREKKVLSNSDSESNSDLVRKGNDPSKPVCDHESLTYFQETVEPTLDVECKAPFFLFGGLNVRERDKQILFCNCLTAMTTHVSHTKHEIKFECRPASSSQFTLHELFNGRLSDFCDLVQRAEGALPLDEKGREGKKYNIGSSPTSKSQEITDESYKSIEQFVDDSEKEEFYRAKKEAMTNLKSALEKHIKPAPLKIIVKIQDIEDKFDPNFDYSTQKELIKEIVFQASGILKKSISVQAVSSPNLTYTIHIHGPFTFLSLESNRLKDEIGRYLAAERKEYSVDVIEPWQVLKLEMESLKIQLKNAKKVNADLNKMEKDDRKMLPLKEKESRSLRASPSKAEEKVHYVENETLSMNAAMIQANILKKISKRHTEARKDPLVRENDEKKSQLLKAGYELQHPGDSLVHLTSATKEKPKTAEEVTKELALGDNSGEQLRISLTVITMAALAIILQ
eukprot:g1885.t1